MKLLYWILIIYAILLFACLLWNYAVGRINRMYDESDERDRSDK
jgi:heme/copper-type cytochrome/quinol oxidase subunit 3